MRRMIGTGMLALVLSATLAVPAGAAPQTIERIPWAVTFAADTTCTGEAVAVTGESWVLTVQDATGRPHYHMAGHVLGLGIGLTTGDPYRFTWTQAIAWPQPASGTYTYTEVYHTTLRHLGSDGGVTADAFASLVMHITQVDGRTVVWHEVGAAGCR